MKTNALSYMKNYIAVEPDFGAPEAVKCEFEEVIKILETITIEDLENFTEWADKNNKTNELNEFKTYREQFYWVQNLLLRSFKLIGF